MAEKSYTYRQVGVSLYYLQNQQGVPGSGSVADATPIRYQTITWDETHKDDLDYAMAAQGWDYAYEGTAPPAKIIAQIVASFLVDDAAQIPVADGWTDVRTQEITTLGSSSIGVQVTALCTGTVGIPQCRVVVNGGAYTDQVIGAAAYDLAGGASLQPSAFHVPCPATQAATYTFKLQMQAQGILGTATPKAGTGITLVENK